MKKRAAGISPTFPVRADYRFLRRLVSSLFSGKVDEKPEEFDKVTEVFIKVGGSWERVFQGSPVDVKLLKDVLRWAFKKGILSKKVSWEP